VHNNDVSTMFTLVNSIWFISICGMTILFFPFLHKVFGPLIKELVNLALKIWETLYMIFEPILYVLSFYIAVESLRYQQTLVGVFIGISAIALFVLSWSNTLINVPSNTTKPDGLLMITCVLIALFSAPLAYLHQSSLISTIILLLLIFGIGAKRGAKMVGASFVCLQLTCIYVLLHTANKYDEQLVSLRYPMNIISSCVYFIILYLACCKRHGDVVYVSHLVGYFMIGNLTNMNGMVTTSKTYAILFVLLKYCKLLTQNTVVFAFFGFCALYYLSFYLNTHPEYITALYDAGLY